MIQKNILKQSIFSNGSRLKHFIYSAADDVDDDYDDAAVGATAEEDDDDAVVGATAEEDNDDGSNDDDDYDELKWTKKTLSIP